MNDSQKIKIERPYWKRYIWIVAVLWTVIVGGSLLLNILHSNEHTVEEARTAARVSYDKDIAYRSWASMKGGVYAPVTRDTLPNPYLDVPERDILTPSGRLLTLINPAYMMRQVYEIGHEKEGLVGHITSLNPTRPENAPDAFEFQALQSFERGETEISLVQDMGGQPYMRLMRPLMVEASCLPCHAAQGYREGDIRGGISVSFPLVTLLANHREEGIMLTGGHLLIWIMGMVGIVLATRRLNRSEYKRTRAEQELIDALKESKQHQTETSALMGASHAVLRHREFKDAARAIFVACKNLVGATAGYVALLSQDEKTNELVFLDPGGYPCAVDPSLPMPTRGLREKVYRLGAAAYENSFARSEWVRYIPAGHVSLDNVLFAPLVVDGKAVGLLGLGNKPGGFTENDVPIVSAFGELVAIALQNSRTLEALEGSEERYRTVVQTASDAVISADSHGNIVLWNRGAQTAFGYSADEAIGKPFTILMPERSREAPESSLNQGASSGELTTAGKAVEGVGLRKDGSEFPTELSLATWKAGKEIFSTVVIRNITERKRTEEELRKYREHLEHLIEERTAELRARNEQLQQEIRERQQAEKKLKQERRIFMGGPVVVFRWVAKENWPVEYVSLNVEQWGYQPDDFMSGKILFASIVHPEDLARVASEVRAYSESGVGSFEQVYRIIRADGEPMWVDDFSVVVRDAKGDITHYDGYVLDITEHKQSEKRLIESEEKYRALMDDASDAIFLIDNEGNFLEANKKGEELLGYTREQLTHMNVTQIHPREELERILIGIREVNQKGSGSVMNSLVLRKDGKIVPVDITGSVVTYGGNRFLQGIMRDITERKLAEEKARMLEAEAIAAKLANQTKSEFLANMSHELRTPLNAVIGFSQVLQEQYFGTLNEKQAEYVKDILESGQHLLMLINDILDLSKVESGKTELELSTVNVKGTLENSLVMVKEKALAHRINLSLQTTEDIGGLEITADERKFKQVMYNLLSNAVKFTPDGGSVTVQASRRGEEVLISIMDTGIGIAPENQRRIFEKFYQVSGGIQDKSPGTGLGLVLSKQMVELHGGKIWFKSEGLGKGSCFTFTLPLKAANP